MSSKDERRVLYLGNDQGYFKTICDRYKTKFSGKKFAFTQLYENDKKKAQLEFLKILSLKPHWIYIDFSENVDCHIEILTFLRREITTKQIPVVGLLTGKENIKKYQNLGADFTMVKDGEFHDVVFHPFYKSFPGEPKMGEFARAKVEEAFFLINDMRIGYITNSIIHAEGSFALKEGDQLEIDIDLPVKNVPSRKFLVKSVRQEDLYYDYQYTYDLELVFVDPPNYEILEKEFIPAGLEPEPLKKIKAEFEKRKEGIAQDYRSQLDSCKKLHSNWVEDNSSASHPKSTKILVLDRYFSLINENMKPINEHQFSIRLQSDLSGDANEIMRLKPQIIAIEYMAKTFEERVASDKKEKSVNENENKKEIKADLKMPSTLTQPTEIDPIKEARDLTMGILKRVTTTVNSMKNYSPFIILFNCKEYNSQMLQDMFAYSNLINFPESVSVEMITKLSQVIERKHEAEQKRSIALKIEKLKKADPVRYKKVSENDFIEKRFYIHKFHPLSNAEIKIEAKLRSITESDIFFDVNQKLELKTYKSIFPMTMSVSLVPMEDRQEFQKDGSLMIYRALIHSVGENDKKKLRSYVNSIFFNELNQKRKAELDLFTAKNQAVIEKKKSIASAKSGSEENEEEEESPE
jgi:hypothetical protein